ncbi:MAG: phosphatidate cytidylyltransferase [Acidimicrobiales bacterium]
MNEYDEHEQGDQAPSEPITERVRIVGATQAGTAAGDLPPPPAPVDERSARYLGFSVPPLPDPPVEEPPAIQAPDLPHWTDPPTGQVPAILDRRPDLDDDEDRAWASLVDSGPVWREHEHEWEDSGFDASLLADDETRVGVLEESPLTERRPWEFDDFEPAVRPRDAGAEGTGDDPPAGTRSPDAGDQGESDEVEDEAWTAVGPATPLPGATRRSSRQAAGRPRAESPPVVAKGARSGRNVPMAIFTGVVVAAAALGCFALGSVASLVIATVVVTLAAAESFASLRRAGYRPATLLGLVATVAVMVSAYSKGLPALALVTVLVMVTAMLWYLFGAEHGSPLHGISATMLTYVWIGVLGSFGALLLAPSIYPHRHGVAFLFGAVVATVGADVGALVFGAWLGRHQLAPHVSPNKTWEGFIGGGLLAVALSIAITGQMHPWTPAKAAVLGIVVAAVAPLGDLCESLVKRDLGLKDMGTLLPGHGGVLDRFDGLLFALPATFYLVRVLHLG